MKTLYDLLGARPNDDAEGLRSAFRKAVKANHPDHHSGDRDASIRFRRIVEAYDILRDAEQRATYDRLLEFERSQHRLKSRRAMRSYALAAAGLAIGFVVGYSLVTYSSGISPRGLIGIAASGSAKISAVDPAKLSDSTIPNEIRGKPAGPSGAEMPIVELGKIASRE